MERNAYDWYLCVYVWNSKCLADFFCWVLHIFKVWHNHKWKYIEEITYCLCTHIYIFFLKYRDILSFDENPVFVHLSTKKIIRPKNFRPKKAFDEMTHSTIKWVAKKFRRKNFRPNVATPCKDIIYFLEERHWICEEIQNC